MGDKYAGPSSYMATDAENQNNALAGGAQNINKKKRPANWHPGKMGNVVSYDMEPIKERVKLKATDAQMRDYERNKPVNTPAGRARYADKAPKIDVRKGYSEGY